MICLVSGTYSVLSEADISIQTQINAVKADAQEPLIDVDQPNNHREIFDELANQKHAVDPGGQHGEETINNQDQMAVNNDDTDELKENTQLDSDINKDKHQDENQDDKKGGKEDNEGKQENLGDSEKNKERVVDEKQRLVGEKRLEPPAPQAPNEVNEKPVQMDTKDNQGKTGDNMANVDSQQKAINPEDVKVQMAAPPIDVDKIDKRTQVDETKRESRVLTETRELTETQDLKTADHKDDIKADEQKDTAKTQNAIKNVEKKDDDDDDNGLKPSVQAMDAKKVPTIKETGNDPVISERKKRVPSVTKGKNQTQPTSWKPVHVKETNPVKIKNDHDNEQETKVKETNKDNKNMNDVEKDTLR
jgi:hypothetical protein